MLNPIGKNVRVVSKDYDPYNISREGFLKIYLKMLELQDPTQPLSTKDMIEQNYQLQQISFLTKLQQTMDSLTKAQQLNYITEVSSLIGKNVVVSTDKITDTSIPYVLISPQEFQNATITIKDLNSGEVVKQITADLKEGLNKLDLSDLEPGEYTVEVTKDGRKIPALLGMQLHVNYISFAGNSPLLGTDYGEQPLENVVYISS